MSFHWHPPDIEDHAALLISEPDHSADVHYGEAREDGTIKPARPFMTAAVANIDLEDAFASFYQAEGNVKDAFVDTVEALHGEIKGQITDEKWEWDRATVRSSGEVVGTPRSIVDTGELLNGQTYVIDP